MLITLIKEYTKYYVKREKRKKIFCLKRMREGLMEKMMLVLDLESRDGTKV